VRQVLAPREGVVSRLGALAVGVAALELGAGRRTKDDSVDHAVGVVCRAKLGDAVRAGDVVAEVHARDEAGAATAAEELLRAYELSRDEPSGAGSIVREVIR
jgi:pyrimidine-nucleoside phosphorylase